MSTASPRTTAPGGGIRVESLLGVPGGQTGGRWSFPRDRDAFDLRVRLSGTGAVAARIELRAEPSGELVDSREERIVVDGETEVTFDELAIPEVGDYTLDLRISGDGVSQRSTVTLRRD